LTYDVLAGLGFEHLFDSAAYFVRDPDAVDIHCSLKGVDTDDGRLWRVLSAVTES
jgi:hypothetical protein